MGQKVSPLLLRMGFIRTWHSRWFAKPKEFSRNILQDYQIRDFIKKKLRSAAVSKVVIERLGERIKLDL